MRPDTEVSTPVPHLEGRVQVPRGSLGRPYPEKGRTLMHTLQETLEP